MLSIRPARIADLPRIMSVLEAARGIMRGSGNINQWVNGYPSEAVIRDDIAAGYGYVVCEPDAAAVCKAGDAVACKPDATAACEPDAAAVCKADAAAACKANAAAACKAGDAVACKADAAAACKAGAIVAYFAFIPSPEPTYARIYGGAWLDDAAPYHVIHRIGSTPKSHGVFRAIMDWCFEREPNIRIDTHRDNAIMRRCILAYGFHYCGIIYLASGDERLAYQLLR